MSDHVKKRKKETFLDNEDLMLKPPKTKKKAKPQSYVDPKTHKLVVMLERFPEEYYQLYGNPEDTPRIAKESEVPKQVPNKGEENPTIKQETSPEKKATMEVSEKQAQESQQQISYLKELATNLMNANRNLDAKVMQLESENDTKVQEISILKSTAQQSSLRQKELELRLEQATAEIRAQAEALLKAEKSAADHEEAQKRLATVEACKSHLEAEVETLLSENKSKCKMIEGLQAEVKNAIKKEDESAEKLKRLEEDLDKEKADKKCQEETISEIQGQVMEWVAKFNHLNEKTESLSNLVRESAKLESLVSQLTEENDKLKENSTRLAKLEQELSQANVDKEALANLLLVVEKLSNHQQCKLESLMEAKGEMESRLSKVVAENQIKTVQLLKDAAAAEECLSEKEALFATKVEKLEQRLFQAEAEKRAQMKALLEMEDEMKVWKRKLEKQVAERDAKIRSLAEKEQNSVSELEKMSTNLKQVLSEKEALTEALSISEKQMKDSEAKVEFLNKSLKKNQEVLKAEQFNSRSKDLALKQNEAKLNELKNALRISMQTVMMKDMIIGQLEQTKGNDLNEQRFKKDREILEQKIKEGNALAENLKIQLALHEAQIEKSQKSLADLRESLKISEEQRQEKEDSVLQLQKSIQNYQETVSKHEKAFEELNQSTTREKANMEEMLMKNEAQVTDLKSLLAEKEAEILLAEKTIAELRASLKNTEEKLDMVNAKVKDLELVKLTSEETWKAELEKNKLKDEKLLTLQEKAENLNTALMAMELKVQNLEMKAKAAKVVFTEAIEDKEKKIKALEDSIAEHEEMSNIQEDKMEKKIQTLEDSIAEHEKLSNIQEDKMYKLEKANLDLKAEISKLKTITFRSQAASRLQEVELVLNKRQAEMIELDAKIENLESEKTQLTSALKSREVMLQEAQRDLAKSMFENNQLEQVLKDLRATSEKEVEQLKEDNAAKVFAINQLVHEIEEKACMKVEPEQETIEQLKASNKELISQIGKINQKMKKHSERYRKKCENAAKKIKERKQQNEKLRQEIANMKILMQDKSMSGEMDSLRSQVEELTSQVQELNVIKQTLEMFDTHNKSEIKLLKFELEDSQRKVEDLKSQIANLQSSNYLAQDKKLEELTKKLTYLGFKNILLRDQLKNLPKIVGDMCDLETRLHAEIDYRKRVVKIFEQEKGDLSAKIKELQGALKRNNIAENQPSLYCSI